MKDFLDKFKFLWRQVPPRYKRHYTLYTFVSVIHAAVFLILPFIFKEVVDAFVRGKFSTQNILLYVVITILGYLSIRLWSLTNVYAREKMRKVLEDKLFSSAIEMDHLHFKTKNSGYWASIFSRDTVMATQMFSDFVYTLPEEGLTLVTVLIVLFIYCLPIFLLTLAVLSAIVFLGTFRDKHVVPEYDKSQESLRKMNELTNVYFKGIEDIKHNMAEGLFLKAVRDGMKAYGQNLSNYLKKDFLVTYLTSSVNEFIKIGSVGLSLFFFLKGSFTFGMAILLIQFASIAYEKANYLFENAKWLQNFPPHIKKVEMVVESPKIKMHDSVLKEFQSLGLRRISVKYSDRWVIKDFSMNLKKGEKVAIVGRSGIGKSTILKVISAQVIPQEGSVRFSPKRPVIGVLSQNPYLFNRTIEENLLMANPLASEDEMMRALKFCGLLEFVESLPNGLETPIGQAGKLISGGEKARMALARIMLLDPELVLVDEPLTGVDKDKREEIFKYFFEFLKLKTCVIVAHDPEMVMMASRRVQLEEVMNPWKM